MIFKSEKEIIDIIEKNLTSKTWVNEARDQHKVLNALVTGKDFHKVLIQRIEKIESEARATARVKYSKDIRDMFDRVMQPRASVFSASGGSVENEIPEGKIKEKFVNSLLHFKGQKPIKKYLSEQFFKLADTDPNGIIFLEYVQDLNIYPTYKSINDIRHYVSNGQLCEYILFEPKLKKDEGGSYMEWRIVDDVKDYLVISRGKQFTFSEQSFKHPFGKVPATILSDNQKTGSEVRISPINSIVELAKDYARDKSIKTIYKFQHGFPRHWRYVKECRVCQGAKYTGVGTPEKKKCDACNGLGHVQKNDVTDIQTIEMPRDSESPMIAPNVEGFVSPDLDTWTKYNEELRDMEELIESTMWGTKRVKESSNETATGRFIDVQPVMIKLDGFSGNVEWVNNQLADWVENWSYGKPQAESKYHINYGRRFIIESPDVILDKYNTARKEGANSTILDKLLDEYILSVYQNNPVLLEEMQKKRQVEPYIHLSIETTNSIFGSEEAAKKVLFVDFWERADIKKTTEQLEADFKTYFSQNYIKPEPVVVPTT